MKTTLLGLGSSAMDTVIACPALAAEDSFQMVTREQILPGGSCANMLTAFASLGGAARLAAKIGDDEYGRLFRASLVEDGVDDSLLVTKPGGSTLHTYVWAADNGSHCIFINLGDSLMDLSYDELPPTLLDEVDIFYTDLFPGAAGVAVAEQCRKRGIPVVVCLQCSPGFMKSAGVSDAEIRRGLSLADLIISGREGYAELTGESDYAAALAQVYAAYRPRLGAICTAGDHGSLWTHADGTLRADVYRITAVDSTGAGDSFLGGLLYSYFVIKSSRAAALDFASAMGALKCLRFGPRIKVGPEEVFAFMAEHRE